jgi:hypothetical protein
MRVTFLTARGVFAWEPTTRVIIIIHEDDDFKLIDTFMALDDDASSRWEWSFELSPIRHVNRARRVTVYVMNRQYVVI